MDARWTAVGNPAQEIELRRVQIPAVRDEYFLFAHVDVATLPAMGRPSSNGTAVRF